MPKIRGVKPDYWTDEDIVDLSIPARLLFIGLWSYACDNGHLQDKPKQIKMRVLPGDDVNCADLLRELTTSGRIDRADGWITVPNFVKHQKPDKRYWQTCEKPGCTKPSGDSQPETRSAPHETPTSPPRGLAVSPMLPPGDGDGDGDGEVRGSEGEQPTSARARRRGGWKPNPTHRSIAAEERVDHDRELKKFTDWADANGKTYKDWDAAFRNWLRNDQYRPPKAARETVDWMNP